MSAGTDRHTDTQTQRHTDTQMPISMNDSMKKPSGVSAPTSTISGGNSVVNFLKDLDKIQEQQMHYTRKVEKEKRRKVQLDDDIKVRSMRKSITLLKYFALLIFTT